MPRRTTDTPGEMTGKPLIESDRVEGTSVHSQDGDPIGSIKRLMIDKLSGRVSYAVMSFDTFLGMGGKEFAIPWGKLHYDTELGGYRTDITEEQLEGAPGVVGSEHDWSDSARDRELHSYWGIPYEGGMR
jgi:hypothetical protein